MRGALQRALCGETAPGALPPQLLDASIPPPPDFTRDLVLSLRVRVLAVDSLSNHTCRKRAIFIFFNLTVPLYNYNRGALCYVFSSFFINKRHPSRSSAIGSPQTLRALRRASPFFFLPQRRREDEREGGGCGPLGARPAPSSARFAQPQGWSSRETW